MKDVSNMPVLLVDDDTQVLHSASIVLRSSGWCTFSLSTIVAP